MYNIVCMKIILYRADCRITCTWKAYAALQDLCFITCCIIDDNRFFSKSCLKSFCGCILREKLLYMSERTDRKIVEPSHEIMVPFIHKLCMCSHPVGIFAGRTGHFVGFVMQLNFLQFSIKQLVVGTH